MTWRITNVGKEMLNFTAALTAVDAGHTRFDIAIPKEADGYEAYSGGPLVYRRPAIQSPARPAIEEQVLALLQGRPYDASKLRVEDTTCRIQRGALETGGKPFRWDDLKMPNAYIDKWLMPKQAAK